MAKGTNRITADMIKEYTQSGQWRNQTLVDRFRMVLGKTPDKTAVVDRDHRLSFRDVEKLSNNLATSFQRLGISQGEVVSFQLPNWYQSVIVYMALTKIGAVIDPVIPIYREREVGFILKQAQSKAMIIPDAFRGFNYLDMIEKMRPDLPSLKHVIVLGEQVKRGMIALESLMKGDGSPPPLPRVDPNQVKLLIYTSGTTAQPKGVQHTHNTMTCFVLNTAQFWGFTEEGIIFMPSPVTHVTGCYLALEMPFVLGCTVVLLDIWDPEKALGLMEKEHCTLTVAATPFLQHMLDSPLLKKHKVSPFTFVCGGAYIPPELIKRAWKEAGWRAFRVYGSSEAPLVTPGIPHDGTLEKAAETDGLVHDYEIKIAAFNNRPLPFGEVGEIAVKGPKAFVGYRDPSLNEDSFDDEGWFYTGDLGRLSPDGYLQITGRKKDIIIRGGENISAKEIEDLLYLHPSVETVAAVAMPDVKLGEKICAYIKLRKGTTLTFQELINFLGEHRLAKQKLPERLEIIDQFPLTPSGKIKKHELRKDIAEKLGLPPTRI
jgi:cyclohexanecarboxylate-CoA ligase